MTIKVGLALYKSLTAPLARRQCQMGAFGLSASVDANAMATYEVAFRNSDSIPDNSPSICVNERDAQIVVETGSAKFFVNRKILSLLIG